MTTEETELTFVRCPSCRSLVPAVATRCRMCGYHFEGDSDEEPESSDTAKKRSRVRQRTISVSKDEVDEVTHPTGEEEYGFDASSEEEELGSEDAELDLSQDSESTDFPEEELMQPLHEEEILMEPMEEEPIPEEAVEESAVFEEPVEEEPIPEEAVEESAVFEKPMEEAPISEEAVEESAVFEEPVEEEPIPEEAVEESAVFEEPVREEPIIPAEMIEEEPLQDTQASEEVVAPDEIETESEPQEQQAIKESGPSAASAGEGVAEGERPLGRKKRRRRRKRRPAAEPTSSPVVEAAASTVEDNYQSQTVEREQKEGSVMASEESVIQSNSGFGQVDQPMSEAVPVSQSGPAFESPGISVSEEGTLMGWFVNFDQDTRGVSGEVRAGRFFIGKQRLRKDDLVIADSAISTPHCLVVASRTDGLRVQDLMSEQGTFIKRKGADSFVQVHDAVLVEHGDRLRFGGYEVLVCLVPA